MSPGAKKKQGRYRSITQRLTWINMLVSGAALLLACSVFSAYELTAFRAAMVRSLSIEAQMIGTNSASALTFDDADAAANTLSALKAAPSIICASIYRPSGKPFAVYWRDGGNGEMPLPRLHGDQKEGHKFTSSELVLTRASVFQGKPIATVAIRSDLREMNDRLLRNTMVMGGVLLLSLLSAFLISASLLRPVTTPVLRLAETARAVSRDKDYSVRAPASENRDEVHLLVESFNEMLSQIQERDVAVQQAHDRLNLTLQSAGIGIWSTDLASGEVTLDVHMYPLLGLRTPRPFGTFEKFLEVVHPNDRERLRRELAEATKNGTSYDTEFQVEWPDGSIHSLSVRGNVDRNGAGQPMGVTGVCWDISEERRADDELRASEERFRTLADSAPVLIWLSGTDRLRTWFNKRWLDFVGHTMEDELGYGWVKNVHPDDAECYLKAYSAAFNERQPFRIEYRLRRHDGVWRNVLASGVPVRGYDRQFAGYIGTCVDVTESKEALEALKASQERYRMLAEFLPHLVWTCTADGLCDYVSPQWSDYTGHAVDEQLGNGWVQHVHPMDRERVQAAWAEATMAGQQFDAEFRIRRADGEYRWFKNRSVPLRDATGGVVKWFGSNTDFEDYKNAEQTLKTHVERLDLLDHITRAIGARQDLYSVFQVVISTLQDSLPIDFGCICLHSPETDLLDMTCIGVASAPLAGRLEMTEGVPFRIDQNGLAKCLRGHLVYEPDVSQSTYEFTARLAQAGLQSVVCAPLLFESKVFGILVAARHRARGFSSGECEFLRQVSEHVALAAQQAQTHAALQQAYDDLHRTQQTVMQQDRLRALGQMASGIAHDINNALSPMALYTESLLQREPNLSERMREYLVTAQTALDDVGHTVGRMQEFYRTREPQLTLAPVQINRLIEQGLELTRARWRDMPQERGILLRLETDLAPDIPKFLGIEGEIRDALTNLVFNATDAMPEGGTLRLRTRAVAGPAGVQVRVEVTDSGIGMDEDTRKRCLEPFFTTKGERGTGLGLAMVYGMLQRHGAEIEIDSARGQGTTVRMIFAADTSGAVAAETHLPQQVVNGLRILIVDDDPMVIRSLRDVLEMDGHAVTAADGGQAGIDTFTSAMKHGELFELVITDLGMPSVDGGTVAAAIKAASPITPVILLTGWGQRLAADNEIPPGVDRVLSKPPKLKELRAAFVDLMAASTVSGRG